MSPTRLGSKAVEFLRSDDGGATVWNVTWLLVFAGFAGLAIDSSNGWRNISISQSTSDAAVLAGAMELPNPLDKVPFDPTKGAYDATVKAKALEYAALNMPWEPYGQVLMPDEIFIGNWYNKNGERRFTPGEKFQDLVDAGLYESVNDISVNAVRVYLFQDEQDRGNGVATSLMHMAGMPYWTVVTTATAMKGYHLCYYHSFMAKQQICQSASGTFNDGMCLYAETGLNLGNGNQWESVSMAVSPSTATNKIADSNFADPEFILDDQNNIMHVPLVDAVPETAHSIMLGQPTHVQGNYETYNPVSGDYTTPSPPVKILKTNKVGSSATSASWMDAEPSVQVADLNGFGALLALLGASQTSTGAPGCEGGRRTGSVVEGFTNQADYDKRVFGIGNGDDTDDVTLNYDSANWVTSSADVAPGTIYYYEGTGEITIEGTLSGVTIISNGTFTIKDAHLQDVTLVSLYDGNGKHGIKFSGNTNVLGDTLEDCGAQGGVRLYAMSSMGGSSSQQFNGALLVSGGSIGLAANANTDQGITAYAAGNLFFTSNSSFTTCGVPTPGLPEELAQTALVD